MKEVEFTIPIAEGDLPELPQYPIVEVFDGPDQPLGIAGEDDWVDLLKDANYDVEGYDLYAVQINTRLIFALKNDGEFITFLFGNIIENYPNQNKTGIEITRSWTPDNFRGKGYSPALYDGLARAGYALVSDQQLSQNAKSVWNKLQNGRGGVKSFDMTKNQYSTLDPNQNPKIRYVLEQDKRNRSDLLMDSVYYSAGYPKQLK